MRNTTVPFDLVAWCERMGRLRGSDGPIPQREAAELLGITLRAYARAEACCRDRPGMPVRKTMARLAQYIEADEQRKRRDVA